jgi:hypothetical protein
MKLKETVQLQFYGRLIVSFPDDLIQSTDSLTSKLSDAFRDFEMAAYNDSKDIILSIKAVLEDKISDCIILADKMYNEHLNKIRKFFSHRPDEEIFDRETRDDERLLRHDFEQLILSRINKLVDLFTVQNSQGEMVEDRWLLYYYDAFSGGGLASQVIGRFEAPKEYLTLRREIIGSIQDRARLF